MLLMLIEIVIGCLIGWLIANYIIIKKRKKRQKRIEENKIKFNIGNIVRLKRGLVEEDRYMTAFGRSCIYAEGPYFENEKTIKRIDPITNLIYFQEDYTWKSYSSDMLEKVWDKDILSLDRLIYERECMLEKKVEEKQMTKDDLEVGYVVKLRNGYIRMVMPYLNKRLILAGNDRWVDLDNYNVNSLMITGYDHPLDIVEIYGRSQLPHKTLGLTLSNRELLWKREEVEEFTISELEELVGFKLKIVKEKHDNGN